jgi:O-antigen/teichoic acid export membrane protein
VSAAAITQSDSGGSQIRTAVRHTAVYGLGNVIAKALGFLMLPLYTRFLKPADYGVLEILDLSMSLTGMLLAAGMTPAVLRSYGSAETAEEKRNIINSAFVFTAIVGIAAFAIVVPFLPTASALLFGPDVPSTYLLLAFSAFVMGYVATLPRTYLRALEASGRFVAIETGSLLLTLVLNVVFIAFLRIGAAGILWSSLIVATLQVVILSAWTIRKTGLGFEKHLLAAMLRFGLPLMFANMAFFILNFADRFFIQHIRSLSEVGLYAVGYKFGFMLNYLVIQPFCVMWQSRMYAIAKEPDHPRIFGQMFILYALVITFAGLALSVFSPEVVHVMAGPEFAGSGSVIPVVAFSYIAYGLGYFAQTGLLTTGRTNLVGVIGTAAAVLNLGLNYGLVTRYGMIGAAWATLISFVVISVASYVVSQRVNPLPLRPARIGALVSVATLVYLASTPVSGLSLPAAVAIKVLLVAIFPLVVFKMQLLDAAERAIVKSARDQMLAAAANAVAGVSNKFRR